MLDPKSNAQQLVDYHTKLVNRCAQERNDWEQDCKMVEMSYKGNKFPVEVFAKDGTSSVSRDRNKRVSVNMIKRQYRVMLNYLSNNEPTYVITGAGPDFQDGDTANARAILDETFEGPLGDEGEGDMTFFDTQMDDVVKYGLRRGMCFTLAYFDKDKGRVMFRTYDPLDCYFDVDAHKLSKIRDFVFTYVMDKTEASKTFPKNADGAAIDWSLV